LLSRRRVLALSALLLAISFGVVRIRHLSNAAAERAATPPARSATPAPAVPEAVPSSVPSVAPPAVSSVPQRRKHKEPSKPEQPSKAASSASPPSIYDEYP
jgi:hypothetical protein